MLLFCVFHFAKNCNIRAGQEAFSTFFPSDHPRLSSSASVQPKLAEKNAKGNIAEYRAATTIQDKIHIFSRLSVTKYDDINHIFHSNLLFFSSLANGFCCVAQTHTHFRTLCINIERMLGYAVTFSRNDSCSNSCKLVEFEAFGFLLFLLPVLLLLLHFNTNQRFVF